MKLTNVAAGASGGVLLTPHYRKPAQSVESLAIRQAIGLNAAANALLTTGQYHTEDIVVGKSTADVPAILQPHRLSQSRVHLTAPNRRDETDATSDSDDSDANNTRKYDDYARSHQPSEAELMELLLRLAVLDAERKLKEPEQSVAAIPSVASSLHQTKSSASVPTVTATPQKPIAAPAPKPPPLHIAFPSPAELDDDGAQLLFACYGMAGSGCVCVRALAEELYLATNHSRWHNTFQQLYASSVNALLASIQPSQTVDTPQPVHAALAAAVKMLFFTVVSLPDMPVVAAKCVL